VNESGVTAAVAAIWSHILQRDIGGETDEDFFALGGSSLTAIELLAQVERTFGVDMGIAELYASPTVRGVAQRICQSIEDR